MPAVRVTAGLAGAAVNAAWALLVFYVFTRPFVPEPGAAEPSFFREFVVPLAAHLGFFGAMAALLVGWAIASGAYRRSQTTALAAAFVVATAYGAAVELAQRTVEGRFPSAGDAVVDALGAALALAFVALVHRRFVR